MAQRFLVLLLHFTDLKKIKKVKYKEKFIKKLAEKRKKFPTKKSPETVSLSEEAHQDRSCHCWCPVGVHGQ